MLFRSLLLNSAPCPNSGVEFTGGGGAGEVALRAGVNRGAREIWAASAEPGTGQKYGAAYGSVRAVFCLFFCGLVEVWHDWGVGGKGGERSADVVSLETMIWGDGRGIMPSEAFGLPLAPNVIVSLDEALKQSLVSLLDFRSVLTCCLEGLFISDLLGDCDDSPTDVELSDADVVCCGQ